MYGRIVLMYNRNPRLRQVFEFLKNNQTDGKLVENPLPILEQNLDIQRPVIAETLRKLEKCGLIVIIKSGVVEIGGGLILKVKILRDNFPANW